MPVMVVSPARSRGFITLARVQKVLPAADPEMLTDLIADASAAIVAFCDREFAREAVTEEFAGDDRDVVLFSRTPIAGVTSIRDRNSVVNPSGYRVYDPGVGLVQRVGDLWRESRPTIPFITSEVNVGRPGLLDYAADYLGGYLMPDDDLISPDLAADATDNAFVGTDLPLLASGDNIYVAGFNDAANNGRHIVQSRTNTRIAVRSTLVTESGTGQITLTCCTLPRDLQRACLDTVVAWFNSQERDSAIVSEKIGDWSATYRGAANNDGNVAETGGLSQVVAARLARWRRLA